MRTGEVEANLVTLNETFKLPYLSDLVARKLSGPEQSQLQDADLAFHETEHHRLRAELQSAHEKCPPSGTPHRQNPRLPKRPPHPRTINTAR
jgi:uncharacterized protein